MYDTARLAHEAGVRNVMVSAGYIEERPLRDLCPLIDGANIDLKSFSNELYESLNAGSLEPVLRTLKILKKEGVWLEITNLLVPDWTDSMDMIKKMCEWLMKEGFEDVPLHFSRFSPMYKLNNLPSTPLSTIDEAYEIAKTAGINHVFIGNVPGHHAQDTFCQECHKKLIDRSGYRIGEIHIEKGKCQFCQATVNGVWE
jgi:pyruvate formate lyase activating enzyme